MKQSKIKFINVMALFFVTVSAVQAEDSLATLMQKLKADPASRVAYQETRTLKLLTEPWHGSGYLYSLPPDLMIREQLKPERLVMGVKGHKTYYFDPKNDQRHQGELSEDGEQSMPLAVFKAIVNADETLLRSLYQVDFSSAAEGWAMHLKPKQASGSVAKVVVSGLSGQVANKVVISQADGDVSEFSLQKEAGAGKSNSVINKLLQELQGE